MPPRLLLVVDDLEDNRLIMQTILEHAGHRVLTADNGQDGVALARAHTPDLILMDLMMPVLDGRLATRALKADPGTAGIPVLAVSAHIDFALELRDDGFCGYLTKPVLPRQVLNAVETCLARTRAGETWVELETSPDAG